jgi:hypothetical protein
LEGVGPCATTTTTTTAANEKREVSRFASHGGAEAQVAKALVQASTTSFDETIEKLSQQMLILKQRLSDVTHEAHIYRHKCDRLEEQLHSSATGPSSASVAGVPDSFATLDLGASSHKPGLASLLPHRGRLRWG